MTPKLPKVLIIVLNWNGLTDTLTCLKSLAGLDYPAYEVLVVDNGSTDSSPAIIRERFPAVMVVENDVNLGYAGGNNIGLYRALRQGSDYALLLNNDTEVAPDFLRHLVNVAESDPQVGIAGPTIYYYDSPDRIWSAGGSIDWLHGRTAMVGLNEWDIGQFGTQPRPVDFVTGCALLVKRAVLERIGGLDERFFTYFEETEWCVRAQWAGFEIVHVPAARIWHKIPLDARDSSPAVHYYMVRNRLLFLKSAHAGWRAWWHTLFGEYLRWVVTWSIRPRWRHKRAHRNATLRGVADVVLGRWGPVAERRVR